MQCQALKRIRFNICIQFTEVSTCHNTRFVIGRKCLHNKTTVLNYHKTPDCFLQGVPVYNPGHNPGHHPGQVHAQNTAVKKNIKLLKHVYICNEFAALILLCKLKQ